MIPWKSIEEHINLPANLKANIEELKNSSIVTMYDSKNLDTKAHWIYYPDLKFHNHRILVRHNFCPNSKGYWTETYLTRFDLNANSVQMYFINEYAYPLNTIGKQEKIKEFLDFAQGKGIYGLGRWGEWQHYNSDVVIQKAMDLADAFCGVVR